MQTDIQQLQIQLNDLQRKIDNFYNSSTIDRNVETALTERFGFDKTNIATLTGILVGANSSKLTAVVPLSGTKVYYVSDSSGGAVTRKLTFTSGILTSET